jgi:Tol biopolymer transport system component
MLLAKRARLPRATAFDKIILGILSLFGLAIVIIIVRGDQVGVQVAVTYPSPGQAVSAFGRVGLAFKQPMKTNEVEARIKIDPQTAGHFVWEGNTVWFTTQQAWQPGVDYHLRLLAGAAAMDGRKVLQDHTLAFEVRLAEILYLSTQTSQLELWSVGIEGGTPRQLSPSGAEVYDFSPARDGEQVAYSVKNGSRGMDIWLVKRDGRQNHLLVDCGADGCSQPAWSPDGKNLVYHRAVAQQSNVSTSGVWTADAQTGQTAYIFPGMTPSFSPDGNQLVTVERAAGVIRILDIRTGKGIELQAATELLPTWFPDSSKMIYANLQAAGALTNVALFQIELSTKQISRLLGGTPSDASLSMPVVAPDGTKLLIGMRVIGGISSEQLYVMDIDGSHSQKITANPLDNNASYSWDPWGTRVVYQQLELGISAPSPQVMVWERQTGKSRVVADHAALPQWLP